MLSNRIDLYLWIQFLICIRSSRCAVRSSQNPEDIFELDEEDAVNKIPATQNQEADSVTESDYEFTNNRYGKIFFSLKKSI